MTESEIRALVCQRFLDGDEEFPLELDTQLLDDGSCDSLGLVRLASEVEKRCPGIKIADQEISRESFGSIRAIQALIQSKKR